MKTRAAIAIIAAMSLCGCSDLGSSSNAANPQWLDNLIMAFQSAPVGNPPQSIWRYSYKGETVYYIPAQCCDQLSVLYDARGNVLCAPDGGFSGRGDGRCPEFFQERRSEVLIWRDPRR